MRRSRERIGRDYQTVLYVFSIRNPQLVREIRQALAELELVSHAPTRNYEGQAPPSSAESIGGRRPPGSDHERAPHDASVEERMQVWALNRQTPAGFRERIGLARTVEDLKLIRSEVESTVRAWKITPLPTALEPEYGSPQWKRYIAESDLDAGKLATQWGVSRQRIYQIRSDYRRAA